MKTPDWILKYDKQNNSSSAGKAIRFFMEREERMLDRIKVLKLDERLTYPTATIFENAPLALTQLSLTTELHCLERMIGLEPSKIPLKKFKHPKS